MELLIEGLSGLLAEFDITCNAVEPSPVNTDLTRCAPASKIDELVARLAIKRLRRFEDIVNVVDFFVRPESNYITGKVIYLGGIS